MRVLITGAGGFVGAALARACQARGDEVHACIRPAARPWRLEPDLFARIEVHQLDLVDFDGVAKMVRAVEPQVVVHAAAAAGHPGTGRERIEAWSDTALATVSLLEAVRPVGCERLVHIGSSLEYEASCRPHTETGRLMPDTPRGVAKAAAYLATRQWAAETAAAVTFLRPFSVFGPGEPRGRVISSLLQSLRRGTPFRTTRGTFRRDFVYIDDVVAAILAAASSPQAIGESFNLGSGVETSTEELISLAERVSGELLRRHPEPFPGRPADQPHWVADISKARDLLDWTPSIGLERGMERLWHSLP